VTGKPRKYALDTNLFIDGFRDEHAWAWLVGFHTAFAPFEFLSAVVLQELRAGVTSDGELRLLVRNVLTPLVRRGRLVIPSLRAWEQSGDVLRELARREGLDLRAVSKAFGNDILLALSCREAGLTLVTANVRDFSRINRIIAFDFVEPWPIPVS
jgi:predicted nucleic acid-binding protein